MGQEPLITISEAEEIVEETGNSASRLRLSLIIASVVVLVIALTLLVMIFISLNDKDLGAISFFGG